MKLTHKFVNETITPDGEVMELNCEEKECWEYNAPHSFLYLKIDENDPDIGEIVTGLEFQKGPIKEVGVNGFSDAEVLLAVLTRMEAFQETKFKCEENDTVIHHLNKALEAMYQRTNKRVARNVEGTSVV